MENERFFDERGKEKRKKTMENKTSVTHISKPSRSVRDANKHFKFKVCAFHSNIHSAIVSVPRHLFLPKILDLTNVAAPHTQFTHCVWIK